MLKCTECKQVYPTADFLKKSTQWIRNSSEKKKGSRIICCRCDNAKGRINDRTRKALKNKQFVETFKKLQCQGRALHREVAKRQSLNHSNIDKTIMYRKRRIQAGFRQLQQQDAKLFKEKRDQFLLDNSRKDKEDIAAALPLVNTQPDAWIVQAQLILNGYRPPERAENWLPPATMSCSSSSFDSDELYGELRAKRHLNKYATLSRSMEKSDSFFSA